MVVWLIGDLWIEPDVVTVAFTARIALGTGIVFGLSPALHATRLDVSSALKDAGGGATSRSRLQRSFIVAQMVLTQALLVAIAMVIGIVVDEMGGGGDNRLASRIVRVQFGTYGGAGSREEKLARIDEVMKRVAGLPGVEAVVPQTVVFDVGDFRAPGADRGSGPRAQETVRVPVEGTPPGYLAFHEIPMLRGRELVASDTAGRDMPVVIPSDLARGFRGSADPIGQRLQMVPRRIRRSSGRPSSSASSTRRAHRSVGRAECTWRTARGGGRVRISFERQVPEPRSFRRSDSSRER